MTKRLDQKEFDQCKAPYNLTALSATLSLPPIGYATVPGRGVSRGQLVISCESTDYWLRPLLLLPSLQALRWRAAKWQRSATTAA
jgi:hypothetical protein